MKLWVIWYRDLWAKSEILDSIWTDHSKAKKRKESINFDFDKFNDFDQYSNIWISPVEADCVGVQLNHE